MDTVNVIPTNSSHPIILVPVCRVQQQQHCFTLIHILILPRIKRQDKILQKNSPDILPNREVMRGAELFHCALPSNLRHRAANYTQRTLCFVIRRSILDFGEAWLYRVYIHTVHTGLTVIFQPLTSFCYLEIWNYIYTRLLDKT